MPPRNCPACSIDAMLRRDLQLTLRCLISAFVWLVLLAFVCLIAAGALIGGSGSAYTPATVAVVDHEDSVISRILIRAVSELDPITGLLTAERMDETEA
ncbi:MAG: ABC transporter permease, partial [Ruminococcaceae bacterium]|nr:ABC transporter permease [Oscillospiraceae bacterium]